MLKTAYATIDEFLKEIILDCWNGRVDTGQIDVRLSKNGSSGDGTKHYRLDARYTFTPASERRSEERTFTDPTITVDSTETYSAHECACSIEQMLLKHGVPAVQEGDCIGIRGRELLTSDLATSQATAILNAVPGRTIADYRMDALYQRLFGRDPSRLCINGPRFMRICKEFGLTDNDILSRLLAYRWTSEKRH